MTSHVEARHPAMVEHVDLCRIADSEQRTVEGNGVACSPTARLRFVYRRSDIVVSHSQTPYSMPVGVKVARERRAE